ncbi:MAG: hypothetical protein KDA77_00015 [Planctomycetaceae bacterium]|nr:hypothetical protein [Planctomycetaceae bacterium]
MVTGPEDSPAFDSDSGKCMITSGAQLSRGTQSRAAEVATFEVNEQQDYDTDRAGQQADGGRFPFVTVANVKTNDCTDNIDDK